MTVQPELPGKVSRDLDDLYELTSQVDQSQTRIAAILLRHGNRLEEVQQNLDLHGARLDRVEGRLDRIEDNQRQQFEHLSAQIVEILAGLRGAAAHGPAPESE